jgi:hypothetical protein
MQHSEQFSQVAAALAQAQGAFPTIPRDRTVKVDIRDKQTRAIIGSYTFKYAPLETILEKTRPGLAAAGLGLVQAIMAEDDGKGGIVEVLRTTLMHASGEWFANDVPMFSGTGDNKAQAYNSGATYARRLGVTLLLCISADEDDDGNGGEQDADKPRPDYHRQEAQTYRGSFPKQGGQQRNAPRAPQRRQDARPAGTPQRTAQAEDGPGMAAQGDDAPFQDDPLPELGLPQYQDGASEAVAHDSDGVITSPWGEGLTPGQLQMAKSRAEVAGLTDAQVLDLTGPITPANVSAALATLKRAADQAMG